MQPRIGGSFAPPLSQDQVTDYRALADSAERPVADAMNMLCDMVEAFHQVTPARLRSTPHPSGIGTITALEKDEVEKLDPHVPWDHEVEAIRGLFDRINPAQKELRDAAFHLLWYAIELSRDRVPLTKDMLQMPEG